MKIYGKILLATLPLVLLGFLVAGGITYYLSRAALTDIAEQWLETRGLEAVSLAREQAEYLKEYDLDTITASVKQAQLDATVAMSNINVGDEGFVYVVDGNGTIVDHPEPSLVNVDIGKERWFEWMSGKPSGWLSYTFDGVGYLASFQYFKDWNWYVVVADPESEVYGATNQLGGYVLILGIVGSILIALVLMIFTRRVTAPLVALVASAEDVGRGKLDTKIEITTRDEIGVLAGAFNQMTEQLRAFYGRLEERLTSVVSNSPILLFSLDSEGRIDLFEGKSLDVIKLNSADIIGRDVADVFAEAPEFLDAIETALSGRTVNAVAGLDNFVFEIWCAPTEKTGGAIGVATDVTKRIQAEERLRKQNKTLKGLSNQLSKYLSPQVYSQIFSGEQAVEISSKRKKLTVFFSDIADFTKITESLESEELTDLLNRHLTEMSDIALQYGATIDKYVGDAIMIFFGDPESRGIKEDAVTCVKMAITMQRRMRELQSEWLDMGLERPFELRIGINTGFCTVGNFGSETRMDYTIIGNEVNLADRLQENAELGSILLAHETHALVKDVVLAEEREPITMKGFARPIRTYSVTGIYDDLAAEGRIIRHQTQSAQAFVDLGSLVGDDREEAINVFEEILTKLKS